MARKALVDDRFIELWADRFMEIEHQKGQKNANAWARSFLNPEDFLRVTAAIMRRRGKPR